MILGGFDLDAGQHLADAAGLGSVERIERGHTALGAHAAPGRSAESRGYDA